MTVFIKQDTGYANSIYIADKATEDILVFGSSRATHHYNPLIIEDSLGMSCYNCGQDGNGIILAYSRLRMIKERSTPKIIIYDVERAFDIYEGYNERAITELRLFYEKNDIADIIADIDYKEKYKMLSHTYRYNSSMLGVLRRIICKNVSLNGNLKGFLPLTGNISQSLQKGEVKVQEDLDIDSLKLKYLNKFIDECKDSELIMVCSPYWSEIDENEIKCIKELCEKRNVPFISFTKNEKYVHNEAYFKDRMHLNAKGSVEFTKDIISILNAIIKK